MLFPTFEESPVFPQKLSPGNGSPSPRHLNTALVATAAPSLNFASLNDKRCTQNLAPVFCGFPFVA